MRIVFAVLAFLLLLTGCGRISSNPEEIIPINSTFIGSSIYTSSGDFDGDGKMESIFITKPDKYCHMSILNGKHIVSKKLNYDSENLKLFIQDINDDGREDIIVNVIQNNCENCYVYTLDTDIITLLSPDIIKAKLNLEEINAYISREHKFMQFPVKYSSSRGIKLYYTEMDYLEDGSAFISEGSVYDRNTNVLNIQAVIQIKENGTAVLKDIDMQPVED